jgi:hypothetical protein
MAKAVARRYEILDATVTRHHGVRPLMFFWLVHGHPVAPEPAHAGQPIRVEDQRSANSRKHRPGIPDPEAFATRRHR